MYTPWGASDSSEHLATGVTFYGTPSHGGIHLDADRRGLLAQMLGQPRTTAVPQWYEEDCDWAIPYAALMPASAKDQAAAMRTLRNWHPYVYAHLTGQVVPADSYILTHPFDRPHHEECDLCAMVVRACPQHAPAA